MNQTNCRDKFNNAVSRFFDILADADRNEIADAADSVFIARDELSGLSEFEWDDAIADMASVKDVLESLDIVLCTRPNLTMTGRKTYKVLNKPMRFDA